MKPPRMWDEERSSPWLLALYAAAFCAATLPAHKTDWPLGDTGLRAGFFVGAATGYRVATGHAVSPMAAITLRWGPVQLLAIPAISPKHASVIHAALVFQL